MAVVVRSSRTVGPLASGLTAAGVPVAIGWTDVPLAEEAAVADLLERVGAAAAPDGVPVVDLLWRAWETSAWPEQVRDGLAGDPAARLVAERDLDAVCALFDLAHRRAELTGALGLAVFRDEVEAQAIPVGAPRAPEEYRPGVAVLTAHRAKGREWGVVVVAGVNEGLWPVLREPADRFRLGDLTDDGRLGPPTLREALAAERRLFYSACGRAREALIVTAVDDGGTGDLRPSRFMDDLGVAVQAVAQPEPGVTSVAGLVGVLRQAATDPGVAPGLREAAVVRLARLADRLESVEPGDWWSGEAGVFAAGATVSGPVAVARSSLRSHGARPHGLGSHGAGPDGLGGHGARPRGLGGHGAGPHGLGDPVSLTASSLEGILECPRRWFLSRRAAAEPLAGTATRLGSLIHGLVQRLAVGELTAEAAGLELDQRWPSLGFTVEWKSRVEQAAAHQALDRYCAWARAEAGRRVVGLEQQFDATVAAGEWTVRLRGRFDRVDADAGGRLRIVDFKTGKTAPTAKQVAAHAQLGLYQLAVAAGGLGADLGPAPVVDGPTLVYLRPADDQAPLPKTYVQAPLAEAPYLDPDPAYAGLTDAGQARLGGQRDYPTWVHHALAAAALIQAEDRYPAVAGTACRYCVFRSSCPVHAVDEEAA
jgi:RecB family exonuclease